MQFHYFQQKYLNMSLVIYMLWTALHTDPKHACIQYSNTFLNKIIFMNTILRKQHYSTHNIPVGAPAACLSTRSTLCQIGLLLTPGLSNAIL